MKSSSLLLAVASCLPLVSAQTPGSNPSPAASAFNWSSITPSEKLEYHDCFSVFKCARLLVPLNYYNSSDTRQAAIAIQKLPAQVPSTDPTFGGSVFLNPGGPGEAGNTFVSGYGGFIQGVIDTPKKKHYEIIGFDPRGVGESTPKANCFTDNPLARPGIGDNYKGTFRLAFGNSYLTYDLAQQKALALACATDDAKHPIMEFMDTQSVTEDLVHAIDAIEAERDASASKRGLENHIRRESANGKARFNYVGFSYGTTLANYFVSLHPERAGKVVFDGVQDADDYANGPGWLKSTQDMDTIIENFLESCFKAGPKLCALTRSTDKSSQDTKDRFYNGLDAIDEAPIPYLDQYGNIGAIVGDDVRLATGTMAYSPVSLYQPFSAVLNYAIIGNPGPLIYVLESTGAEIAPQAYCNVNGSTAADPFTDITGFEALAGVLCLDGESVVNKTTSYWSDYIQEQLGISKIYGTAWSTLRFSCSNWPFKHQGKRFTGPFTTKTPSLNSTTGPQYPFLFLSSRYDPVTPLDAARRMAKGHPGSQVVVQESTGHTALIAAQSNCTYAIVAKYFLDGTVPSKETVCQENCGPWDAGCTAQPPGTIPNTTAAAGSGVEKRATQLGMDVRDIYHENYDWSKFKVRKSLIGVERPTVR